MELEHKLVHSNPDGILRVIIPGRISTKQQDEESIDASQEDNETWLRRVYSGEVIVTNLGEQASGWLVDRESMELARSMIKRGEVDLVLMGEIRELYRNPRLQWAFVQDCMDADTRMIALWDSVDTAKDDWEINMHVAILRHGMTVPETRRRVKRKATYSFNRGGMVMKVRFGYRKLTEEEAKSGEFGPKGLMIAKQSECAVWILEMRRRVLGGYTDELVAKWLNELSVPTGPYVESKKWTGRLVRELLTDPVLSGRRRFRKNLSRLIYGTGKHKTQPNPSPLMAEECPELAFMTPEEQDEMLLYFVRRKEGNKGAQKSGRDSPLWDVPRKHSFWPGQGLRCSACRSFFYLSGDVLKCKNALPDATDECWNHVVVPTDEVKAQVLSLLWAALAQDTNARKLIAEIAWKNYQQSRKGSSFRLANVRKELKECEKEVGKLLKLLDIDPDLETVAARLSFVEQRRKRLLHEEKGILAEDNKTVTYATVQDLDRDLFVVLAQMARESREFSILLRKLIVGASVVPVQSLDCPQVRPRLTFTISFAAFAKNDGPIFEEHHTVDLFERPLHVKHMQACLDAKAADPQKSLKTIAADLKDLKISHMTVKRALGYAKLMEREGLTEPYRILTEKPLVASRWHAQNPRSDAPSETTLENDGQRKAS